MFASGKGGRNRTAGGNSRIFENAIVNSNGGNRGAGRGGGGRTVYSVGSVTTTGAGGNIRIYEDAKGIRYRVPNHGAKEIGEGLRKKIIKDMELE